MKSLRCLVVFGMSMLLFAPAATAFADARPGERDTVVMNEKLGIVEFDEAVAEANGYRIITVEGYQASVPAEAVDIVRTLADVRDVGGELTSEGWEQLARSESDGPVTTGYMISHGTCGSSRLELNRSGNAKYTINTGFNLTEGRRAVDYSWRTVVSGPGYVREYNWGGSLLLRTSWRNGSGTSNGRGVSVPNRGTYTATVAAGTGIAILSNGGVCSNNSLIVTEPILS